MPTLEDIINIGFSNHQGGRLELAETAYQEVLKQDSENAEVCNLMGVLKLQQNSVEEALSWVEKAISLKPCEYFYETFFQTCIRKNEFQKITELEKTVTTDYPKSFSLLFNLALAFKNLGQNAKAIEFYDKALKIDPTSYQAWFNIATLYSIEAQCKNAVSALKICKKLRPNDSETDYFLSIALMRTKNYDKGLKLFENRLCRQTALSIQNKTYPNLANEKTLWRGENIKNKTILVYYEAGFGDVIMFSRYLPLLKKRCKKIVFLPQKPLVPLFAESNLGIDELIEGYIPEQNMNFDVHVPLMSLPYLLGLKGRKVFESPEGYIFANKDLVQEYKENYFNNDKLKIGFKWQGNTYYDKDRVIQPEHFLPLFELENTQFYSFQTFEGSEHLEKLTKDHSVIDIGKDLLDFSQTAAALENLDLVICNDTSLAHLAGAMGIPCFVMLPYDTNWRWHNNLPKCDWYNSVSLFRQKTAGDWQSVFEDVKKKLISIKDFKKN